MLRTDRLIIMPLERKFIEFARNLHNDIDTIKHLSDPELISELQQEKWFENISLSRTSKRFVAIERWFDQHNQFSIKSDYAVGIIRVDNIDEKNKSLMIGLDIDKNYRGKKYSYEIYKCIMDYYFNFCGFNRIYLYVLETNTIAKHIYDKLGFKEEGRQIKAVFRDGKYIDYIAMYILREDFNA